MNIGVISDIHGPLPDIVHMVFRGCDAILCAGDTESVETYEELKSIAPTTMVYGNCDAYGYDYGTRVVDKATPSFEGVRFCMVHKPEDVGELPRKCQCVITGHTHIPEMRTEKGITYLNPGSPTRPLGGSNPSVALINIEERELMKVVLVDLYNPGPALREFQGETAFGGFSAYDDFGHAGRSTSGGFSAFNEVDFSEIFQ